MLRIGKLTDYASRVMTCLAREPERIHAATELAQRTGLELPTVSKLLKSLSRGALVVSVRGANGGYRLARSPRLISVAEVVVAMEGPIGMTECSVHSGQCSHESICTVKAPWVSISRVIEQALREVSLADLAGQRREPEQQSIPIRLSLSTD